MLKLEKKFPDFNLQNQQGEQRQLNDYQGSWLVLFFYSKDNTSACTKEVENFGQLQEAFIQLDATIVGISGDSVKTHQNFANKLGIKYELLSDPGRSFIDNVGLLKDKKMYGKPVKGVIRSTYLIDPQGKIQAEWSGVKVPGHAQEVLAKLHDLKNKNT